MEDVDPPGTGRAGGDPEAEPADEPDDDPEAEPAGDQPAPARPGWVPL